MDRQEYIKKLELQLKEWDGEIQRLEAKAEQKDAHAKTAYHAQIEGLRDQRHAAQNKLDEVKRSDDGTWQQMESGIVNAFDTMTKSFHSAMSKFH